MIGSEAAPDQGDLEMVQRGPAHRSHHGSAHWARPIPAWNYEAGATLVRDGWGPAKPPKLLSPRGMVDRSTPPGVPLRETKPAPWVRAAALGPSPALREAKLRGGESGLGPGPISQSGLIGLNRHSTKLHETAHKVKSHIKHAENPHHVLVRVDKLDGTGPSRTIAGSLIRPKPFGRVLGP